MRVFMMLIMLMPYGVGAVDDTAPEPARSAKALPASSGVLDSGQVSGQLLQLALGLLLVIGLIFLLAWVVRRVQQTLPVKGSNQVISLLATQALGPRDRLVLVQVGQEQVLLGLTPGTITPLHVLQHPVVIDTPPTAMTSAFAQRLASVLNTSTKDKS